MNKKTKQESTVEVNGELITLEEFYVLKNLTTKKLKEVSPGKYKLLERLFG
jgi:hypothetical protein